MNNYRGFTLIEMVIVIVLLGIIAVVGSKILSQGFIGYLDTKSTVDADAQARLALERMQRDIRAIRSPADLTTAGASQITFVNWAGNTLTYSLSGTNLMLQVNSGTSQILASGVQSLTFSYFDRNGLSTATLLNIRYVSISMNIVLNNTNYTIATAVYPRNSP